MRSVTTFRQSRVQPWDNIHLLFSLALEQPGSVLLHTVRNPSCTLCVRHWSCTCLFCAGKLYVEFEQSWCSGLPDLSAIQTLLETGSAGSAVCWTELLIRRDCS